MDEPAIDYAALERTLTTENPEFPRRGEIDNEASILALTPTMKLNQNWRGMSYLHRIYRPVRNG